MRPVVVLLSVFLVACGPLSVRPLTIDYVRHHPAGTVSFSSDRDYETVYRAILAGVRQCYRDQPLTKELIVEDSFDRARRWANVSVVLIHGKTERDAYLVTDIQGTDAGADVQVHYVRSRLKEQAEDIRGWIVDGQPACPDQGA